jgi:hypothetical protein
MPRTFLESFPPYAPESLKTFLQGASRRLDAALLSE